jgi:DNA polymerase-3 subunit epsilon
MRLRDRLSGSRDKLASEISQARPGSGAAAASAPVTDRAFLAVDFETATAQRASACAVGFALFEDGLLRDAGATLIDPGIEPDEWNAFNILIHGIHPGSVAGAPSFEEVWSELEHRFADVPLVAHYAAFDMGVLRSELGRARLRPTDTIRYTCSASMARAAWPDLLSVALPILADELDIELDHHEPGSDARASGAILLRAVHALGASDVDDALHRVHRVWGQIRQDLTVTHSSGTALHAKDFAPNTGSDPDGALYGQTIVFTGTLHSMTRREAFQLVSGVGARPGDGVTKATNILVVGEQDIARLAAGETLSAKQRKAAKMRLDGQDIQLMSEMEFLRML